MNAASTPSRPRRGADAAASILGFAWFYLRPIRAALAALFVIAVNRRHGRGVPLPRDALVSIDLLGSADRATVLSDHAVELASCRSHRGGASAVDLGARGAVQPAHRAAIDQPDRWRASLHPRARAFRISRATSPAVWPTASSSGARRCVNSRRLHRHAPLRGDLRDHSEARAVSARSRRGSPSRCCSDRRLRGPDRVVRAPGPGALAQDADTRSTLIVRIVDATPQPDGQALRTANREERAAVQDAVDSTTAAYLHQFLLVTLTTTASMDSSTARPDRHRCRVPTSCGATAHDHREASAGLALVLRLIAKSGLVLQTVRGVFENVASIQEAMQTMAPAAPRSTRRTHSPSSSPAARSDSRRSASITDAATPRSSRIFLLTIRPGERSAGRRHGRGQVDPGGSAPAPLNDVRAGASWRTPGPRRLDSAIAARSHRDGQPGHVALCPAPSATTSPMVRPAPAG